MSRFEEACTETHLKATDLLKAAKQIERVSNKLRKAAQLGDHSGIVAATNELDEALAAIQASSYTAQRAWPFDDAEVTSYLASGYEAELIHAGKVAGLTITSLDDRLVAFPVVIQILPTQRAIRVDAIRTAGLRPSAVVGRVAAQRRKAGAKPQQFIETLYNAYKRASTTHTTGATLSDLYEVLTLHPETRRVYGRAEFARDVFCLDTSDIRATRSGAIISFPASTGTKGGRGVFVVVPENGMPKHYYGIRFQEVDR